MTGVTSLSVEVSRKRLEFMSELFPAAKRFAIAANPTSPTVRFAIDRISMPPPLRSACSCGC